MQPRVGNPFGMTLCCALDSLTCGLAPRSNRHFGFRPQPFYAAGIALHALCVLALYAICLWRAVPRSVAFWAAVFFAVQEGHQEAVGLRRTTK